MKTKTLVFIVLVSFLTAGFVLAEEESSSTSSELMNSTESSGEGSFSDGDEEGFDGDTQKRDDSFFRLTGMGPEEKIPEIIENALRELEKSITDNVENAIEDMDFSEPLTEPAGESTGFYDSFSSAGSSENEWAGVNNEGSISGSSTGLDCVKFPSAIENNKELAPNSREFREWEVKLEVSDDKITITVTPKENTEKPGDNSSSTGAGSTGQTNTGSTNVSTGSNSGSTTETLPAKGYVNTRISNLNVRDGQWGNIIGKLPKGTEVKVLGREGDWIKIDYNGREAYVHSKYIASDRNAPPPAGPNPTPPWISGGTSGGTSTTSGTSTGTNTGSNPGSNTGSTTGTSNGPGNGGSNGTVSGPGSGSTTGTNTGSTNTGTNTGTTAGGNSYVRPVASGRVSSEFGPRWGRHHNGIDIAVPEGTPVRSPFSGTVVKQGWSNSGGNYVDIRHDNGYTSRYYHLSSVTVKNGTRVNAGDVVALSGNTGSSTTGPHLHWEIRDSSGRFVNPRNVPGVRI